MPKHIQPATHYSISIALLTRLYCYLMHSIYKLLTWLVLLLGLTGSGVVSYWMKVDAEARTYQQFVYNSEEIKLKIEARLKAHEQTLLSGAAMFDASETVTRQEWQSYVQRLRINQHFNGIQGLGFSLWIPAAQLPAHKARIRAEGFPDYQVRPEDKRETYSSIIFLEPFANRNLRAFGYDMYSEPVRRAAMARARDENSITLSGRVTLVQETDKDIQAGTLMYVPVYRKNQPIATVEQRRAALFGWVYSPFRISDLLTNIVSPVQENKGAQVQLRVYDGDNTQAEHLLYASHKSVPDNNNKNILLTSHFNGIIWTLQFEQITGAGAADYSKAWITLMTGFFISTLLFLLSYSYLNTRINAARIAARLTEQLQESESRFRLLADSAPVLIWLAGTDKLCYQFNKGWLNFTGRTLSQEAGHGWRQGIHSDDFQHCMDTYNTAFETHLPFTKEFRLRRYDNEYRWLLDTGMPRFADDGVFLGYIGSCVDITDRKYSEQTLKESELKFKTVANFAYDWEYWVDKNGQVIYMSPSCERISGYTAEEFLADRLLLKKIIHPDDEKRWDAHVGDAHFFEQEHDTDELDFKIIKKDSSIAYIGHLCRPVFDDNGHSLGRRVSNRDVTERKQTEAALRIAATVFESQEGMMITDANEVILNVNRAFSLITGYSADDVIGKTPRILHSEHQNKEFYKAIWQDIHNTGAWQGEIWNRRKNGEVYPEQLTITAVKGNDNIVTHYVATLFDITERKATEEYIHHLAFYDQLTQLPNRRLLQERLKHGIELNRRTGSQMAVLMMDLDKFKAVNDTLGHAAGDELLQQVAKRIKARLRKVDLVARLGGDEFVILIENARRCEDVAHLAEVIIHTLSQPFTLSKDHEVFIGASIGVAIHPQHGSSVDELMDNADAALYHAKEQGRGCFACFSEEMTRKI